MSTKPVRDTPIQDADQGGEQPPLGRWFAPADRFAQRLGLMRADGRLVWPRVAAWLVLVTLVGTALGLALSRFF